MTRTRTMAPTFDSGGAVLLFHAARSAPYTRGQPTMGAGYSGTNMRAGQHRATENRGPESRKLAGGISGNTPRGLSDFIGLVEHLTHHDAPSEGLMPPLDPV